MADTPTIRAWAVYVRGWGDKPQSVTMASSRSRAIARNLTSAQGAGYTLKWADFRAVRAADFDAMLDRHGVFSWHLEHAQRMLADQPAAPQAERSE